MAAVGRQSPFILQTLAGTKKTPLSVSATGSAVTAQSGVVTVNAEADVTANQLTPFMLPALRRNFGKPGTSINISLTGAAVLCQGEELEGADITIRIDGTSIRARPGLVSATGGTNPEAEDVNPGAEPVATRYEICEISGQKLYPGEAVRDWKGRLVNPRYADPEPQRESLHYKSVEQQGAKFTEADDQFIATSIAPEDL